MSEQFDQLGDLLTHELQDLYDAEHRLLDALREMAEAASDSELKASFEEHRQETEGHVKRLEAVFTLLDQKPERSTCKAMQGLIKEGKEAIKADGDRVVNDLALIAAAQRVEHYEIAAYGSARTMAKMANQNKVAEYLQETLDEEGAADHKLTDLAEQLYVHVV